MGVQLPIWSNPCTANWLATVLLPSFPQLRYLKAMGIALRCVIDLKTSRPGGEGNGHVVESHPPAAFLRSPGRNTSEPGRYSGGDRSWLIRPSCWCFGRARPALRPSGTLFGRAGTGCRVCQAAKAHRETVVRESLSAGTPRLPRQMRSLPRAPRRISRHVQRRRGSSRPSIPLIPFGGGKISMAVTTSWNRCSRLSC